MKSAQIWRLGYLTLYNSCKDTDWDSNKSFDFLLNPKVVVNNCNRILCCFVYLSYSIQIKQSLNQQLQVKIIKQCRFFLGETEKSHELIGLIEFPKKFDTVALVHCIY